MVRPIPFRSPIVNGTVYVSISLLLILEAFVPRAMSDDEELEDLEQSVFGIPQTKSKGKKKHKPESGEIDEAKMLFPSASKTNTLLQDIKPVPFREIIGSEIEFPQMRNLNLAFPSLKAFKAIIEKGLAEGVDVRKSSDSKVYAFIKQQVVDAFQQTKGFDAEIVPRIIANNIANANWLIQLAYLNGDYKDMLKSISANGINTPAYGVGSNNINTNKQEMSLGAFKTGFKRFV